MVKEGSVLFNDALDTFRGRDRNKQGLKTEHYLMWQVETIYKYLIKLSFSSIAQDKSKLQEQTRLKKNGI